MPRIPRLLISNEPTVYHIISKTALTELPLEKVEKEYFLDLIKKLSNIYFVEIIGFCIMSNHFHLLVRMHPSFTYSDDEVINRFHLYYENKKELLPEQIPFYREKWSNLSKFIKEIKQTFSKYYNKHHNRSGYFWNDRFKSLIIEKGEALISCLAYIDLNPVRAGIAKRPEDYRWSSMGYHAQTGNSDQFLSLEIGVQEFGGLNVDEQFRLYRKFVYATGAAETDKGAAIDKEIIEKELRKNFEWSRTNRFKHRCRYFSDSRIFGSKRFVEEVYSRFKTFFQSSDTRKANPIKGFDGIYSLKRLKE